MEVAVVSGGQLAVAPRRLQDQALLAARLGLFARHESSAGGVLKDLADTLAGSGRALKVLVSANLLADLLTLLRQNRLLAGLAKLLDDLGFVAQILLAADENDGKTLAEVQDLGDPLLLDVVEGVRGIDGEADQDNVGIGVREGAKAIVIFLTSGIPEGELDVLAIDLDVGDVVLEDGGDVDLGESALGEDDQQAGFTTGTVTDDDELTADLSHYERSVM